MQQLEDIVSDNTILASNTSSLSITAIAANCKKPERVVGYHFLTRSTHESGRSHSWFKNRPTYY